MKKAVIFLVTFLILIGHNISHADTGYREEDPEPQLTYRETWTMIEKICNISAYTGDPDENDGYDNINNVGEQLREGYVAMDGVPKGSIVEFEVDGEMKTFVVNDIFNGGYASRIDMYVATKKEAFKWGRQYKTVKIYLAET